MATENAPADAFLLGQETLILDATEEICRVMARQKVIKAELARRLGVTPASVTQMLSGERNLTLRSLADIASVLGCEWTLRLRRPTGPAREDR